MPTEMKPAVDEVHGIDFQDPNFILQNITYNTNFAPDTHSFSSVARNNMIECMCDQVCFHVMCALRAHHLASSSTTLTFEERLQIKPPGILVYGSGVVAECLLEALAEMGCAPFIKVFARDIAGAKMWASKGYRSTIEMRDGYQISILLICCNLVGFSQLCRDLAPYLTAKTFIISNVFNLQRKRMYNLFGTPGIVRTFVERKGATRRPQEREISNRAFSARQLASKVNGVKNLILILENYMIALDIHKDTARREAMHLVVGSDRVSLDERRMRTPYKNKKNISFSDEEDSSDEEEDFDADFDSDSDSSTFESIDGRAKEVALNLNPTPLTDKETRQALFELRVRSFAAEDAMEEARKKIERKEKRKQGRLEQQLKQNKLNHDVHKRMLDSTMANVPATSTSLTIETEPPAARASPAPSPSPSPSSHSRFTSTKTSPKPGKNSSASSSPVIPASSYLALSRFHKAHESESSEKSPPRERRIAMKHGFSGSKLKRMNNPKSNSSDDGSSTPHGSNMQRPQSSPHPSRQEREDKKAREEQEAIEHQEKKDQAWLNEGKDNKDKDKVDDDDQDRDNDTPFGFLQHMVASVVEQPHLKETMQRKSPLLKIIRNIEKRYGEIFRRELSKHISVVDLPSLAHVKQKSPRRRRKRRLTLMDSVLTQRASLARKNTLLSVMPTVVKQQVGYLTEDELLDIYNSDKKASILFDDRSPLLEKMDEESDDEDKDGEGDDLFIEDVPRDKFRFFVLESEEDQVPHSHEKDKKSRDEDTEHNVTTIRNMSSVDSNASNHIRNMPSMEGLQDI